jgi:hypothetical protein
VPCAAGERHEDVNDCRGERGHVTVTDISVTD